MITYRLSNNYSGMEGQAKLSEFSKLLPGQAAGMLLALHELGAADTEVTEAAVVEHISKPENYKRLWPNSDDAKNQPKTVANTVAQYRPNFKLLPFLQVVAEGRKVFAQGPRKPETLTDPITGETFANPFLRRRKGKKGEAKAGAQNGQAAGQAAA